MPELPEVETVKRGLESLIKMPGSQILKIESGDKKLRYHPNSSLLKKICNKEIKNLTRKAKYLLFELDDYILLSHLGMTGSWRIEKDQRKHDHIRIFLSDGRILTYHDPRRFGMFEVLKKETWTQDQRIAGLGLDPVEDDEFCGEWLYEVSRNKTVPVKVFIMNQKFIVGVGNIYASEALFLSGIHPLKKAGRLSKEQCQRLADAIVEVLLDAIHWGGTTISDFKSAGGSEGYFQNLLLVYGRDKEECVFCNQMIQSQTIVGRNSFWCPKCQKKG